MERIEKKAFDFTIFDQVNVQFLRSSNEKARLEDSWRICTRQSDLWIGRLMIERLMISNGGRMVKQRNIVAV